MNFIYLLLGSNQGNRAAMLTDARRSLNTQLGTIMLSSPIYETAAWGKTDQAPFLNQALVMTSPYNAFEALNIIHDIESKQGRRRSEHWGERTLDIDILFFNNEHIYNARLVVPHPEIQNRRFALVPLCDITPAYIHPILGKPVSTLLAECTDDLEVFVYQGH